MAAGQGKEAADVVVRGVRMLNPTHQVLNIRKRTKPLFIFLQQKLHFRCYSRPALHDTALETMETVLLVCELRDESRKFASWQGYGTSNVTAKKKPQTRNTVRKLPETCKLLMVSITLSYKGCLFLSDKNTFSGGKVVVGDDG